MDHGIRLIHGVCLLVLYVVCNIETANYINTYLYTPNPIYPKTCDFISSVLDRITIYYLVLYIIYIIHIHIYISSDLYVYKSLRVILYVYVLYPYVTTVKKKTTTAVVVGRRRVGVVNGVPARTVSRCRLPCYIPCYDRRPSAACYIIIYVLLYI